MALNLVQHRGAQNVWAEGIRPTWDVERWLAALAAGALLVSGVRRQGVGRWLQLVAGGALAAWAASGIEVRRTRRARVLSMWPSRVQAEDQVVGEASEESFPASDAPAWTPTTGSAGPDG